MCIPPRLQLTAQIILAIVVIAPGQAAEPNELRLMTYNVHHCEGVDGKLDIERIGTVIKNQKCDLVALQEIDRKTTRSQQVDQWRLCESCLAKARAKRYSQATLTLR